MDTRRVALRARYGGLKIFYDRLTLPTLPASTQSKYTCKNTQHTNTPTHKQHTLSRNVYRYKPTCTLRTSTIWERIDTGPQIWQTTMLFGAQLGSNFNHYGFLRVPCLTRQLRPHTGKLKLVVINWYWDFAKIFMCVSKEPL